jgi:hypothetical protein
MLLPLNQMSVEAREILNALSLTHSQKVQLMKSIADGLTCEKAHELMITIIDNCGDYEEHALYDKALWLVRMAYLNGFSIAIDAYSGAFEMALREDGSRPREEGLSTTAEAVRLWNKRTAVMAT